MSDRKMRSEAREQIKEEKKMYVLTYSDFLEEWTFTTKKNYERRIQNARETDYFSKRDGFQCATDVINYVREYFDIELDQITRINC